MRAAPGIILLFMLGLTLALSGCQGNPFLTAQRGQSWQQQQEQQPPYVAQMQDLNRRNSDLDSNNRDLHSQFAQSQQRSQVLSDEVALLRNQLSDTVDKLKTEQTARQDVDNRLSALQASTQFRGGATLKANNSIKESLRLVDVPGLEVRQDGDVIRIELPVDRLFQAGTAQLIPTGTPLLDQVAASITRHYRRQRIGIEGHSDNLAVSPNMPIKDIRIDKVFIGSCTNGRIEDLRSAARYAKGKKVASGVRAMVVPGSGLIKQQAEKEGLDKIFLDAGFEWREPGCSMCLGMNPDLLETGDRCASTSNRNFEGRQGKGGRTHLVSPAMAVAAAITGHFVDIRNWNFN